MWDSGCIESYESESAAEQEREKLNLASSPPPPSSAPRDIKPAASTPLNEEAKKTYAEVCRGAPAASASAASGSNDDKGDLASAAGSTEDGERVSLLLFCGESLKIVEESKNDGEKVGGGCCGSGDDGKAASVTPPVTVSDSSVAAVAAAKEAKDNIDECEGGQATSPPPG